MQQNHVQHLIIASCRYNKSHEQKSDVTFSAFIIDLVMVSSVHSLLNSSHIDSLAVVINRDENFLQVFSNLFFKSGDGKPAKG